jgi:hypothetical protein
LALVALGASRAIEIAEVGACAPGTDRVPDVGRFVDGELARIIAGQVTRGNAGVPHNRLATALAQVRLGKQPGVSDRLTLKSFEYHRCYPALLAALPE